MLRSRISCDQTDCSLPHSSLSRESKLVRVTFVSPTVPSVYSGLLLLLLLSVCAQSWVSIDCLSSFQPVQHNALLATACSLKLCAVSFPEGLKISTVCYGNDPQFPKSHPLHKSPAQSLFLPLNKPCVVACTLFNEFEENRKFICFMAYKLVAEFY